MLAQLRDLFPGGLIAERPNRLDPNIQHYTVRSPAGEVLIEVSQEKDGLAQVELSLVLDSAKLTLRYRDVDPAGIRTIRDRVEAHLIEGLRLFAPLP